MSAHLVQEPRFLYQILPKRKQTKRHRRPKLRLHRIDPATNFSSKRAERHKIIHQAKHYLRSNIRWVECLLEQMREEIILAQIGMGGLPQRKRTCHSEIAPVHLCPIE
jgi:hypothetical protein